MAEQGKGIHARGSAPTSSARPYCSLNVFHFPCYILTHRQTDRLFRGMCRPTRRNGYTETAADANGRNSYAGTADGPQGRSSYAETADGPQGRSCYAETADGSQGRSCYPETAEGLQGRSCFPEKAVPPSASAGRRTFDATNQRAWLGRPDAVGRLYVQRSHDEKCKSKTRSLFAVVSH